jgi:hypothetical protein
MWIHDPRIKQCRALEAGALCRWSFSQGAAPRCSLTCANHIPKEKGGNMDTDRSKGMAGAVRYLTNTKRQREQQEDLAITFIVGLMIGMSIMAVVWGGLT